MELVALAATVFGEVALADRPRKNGVYRVRYVSETLPP